MREILVAISMLLSGLSIGQNLNGFWVGPHDISLEFDRTNVHAPNIYYFLHYRSVNDTLTVIHDNPGWKRKKDHFPNSIFAIKWYDKDSLELIAINPAGIFLINTIYEKKNHLYLDPELFKKWNKTHKVPDGVPRNLDTSLTLIRLRKLYEKRSVLELRVNSALYNMDAQYFFDLEIETDSFWVRKTKKGYSDESAFEQNLFLGTLDSESHSQINDLFSNSGIPSNGKKKYQHGIASHATIFNLYIKHDHGEVTLFGYYHDLPNYMKKFYKYFRESDYFFKNEVKQLPHSFESTKLEE